MLTYILLIALCSPSFTLFKDILENICTMAQIALWLLAFAGLSDLADGWIARTWTSQASKLGSFLDPVADKLLVGTLFLSLAWVDLIPVPLTCLVVTRDVVLVTAASYIRYRSLPPPVFINKLLILTVNFIIFPRIYQINLDAM